MGHVNRRLMTDSALAYIYDYAKELYGLRGWGTDDEILSEIKWAEMRENIRDIKNLCIQILEATENHPTLFMRGV